MTPIQLKNNWLIKWVVLSISAPLLSFAAGYGYLYALALLYPLAQTIAIEKIPKVRMPWLWMFYSVYWFLLIRFSSSYEFTISGILLSSILGQLLLRIMFGTFGGFKWLLFNSIGFVSIIIVFYILRDLNITNDFVEISLVIGISFVSAFLSGLGIKLSYIN